MKVVRLGRALWVRPSRSLDLAQLCHDPGQPLPPPWAWPSWRQTSAGESAGSRAGRRWCCRRELGAVRPGSCGTHEGLPALGLVWGWPQSSSAPPPRADGPPPGGGGGNPGSLRAPRPPLPRAVGVFPVYNCHLGEPSAGSLSEGRHRPLTPESPLGTLLRSSCKERRVRLKIAK